MIITGETAAGTEADERDDTKGASSSVVSKNNSIIREKSKILKRVVRMEHKILAVCGMPDLICMSNILQENPAGSLFPFFKRFM